MTTPANASVHRYEVSKIAHGGYRVWMTVERRFAFAGSFDVLMAGLEYVAWRQAVATDRGVEACVEFRDLIWTNGNGGSHEMIGCYATDRWQVVDEAVGMDAAAATVGDLERLVRMVFFLGRLQAPAQCGELSLVLRDGFHVEAARPHAITRHTPCPPESATPDTPGKEPARRVAQRSAVLSSLKRRATRRGLRRIAS